MIDPEIRTRQCRFPTLDDLYPANPTEMMVGHYMTPGRVSYWDEADTEAKYDANGGHPLYGKTDITYAINSHGYRGPEFDTPRDGKYVIAVIGCSNTKGVGLPVYDTYCEILARSIEMDIKQPVLAFNLGQGGASNDKIALRAFSAARFLKPDFMFVQWTYASRAFHVEPSGLVYDWWSLSEKEISDPKYDHIRKKIKYVEHVQTEWNDGHRYLNMVRTTGMALSQNQPFGYLQHMMFRESRTSPLDRIFDHRYTITQAAAELKERARDHNHRGREVNREVADVLHQRFMEWYRASKSIA